MRNRVINWRHIHQNRCLIEQLGVSEEEKQTLIHKRDHVRDFV